MIAAAVYVPLLDGRPVAEPGAADSAAGPALADVVADLAALHSTIEQMGALRPPVPAKLACVGQFVRFGTIEQSCCSPGFKISVVTLTLTLILVLWMSQASAVTSRRANGG